jgi:hypothetical protein
MRERSALTASLRGSTGAGMERWPARAQLARSVAPYGERTRSPRHTRSRQPRRRRALRLPHAARKACPAQQRSGERWRAPPGGQSRRRSRTAPREGHQASARWLACGSSQSTAQACASRVLPVNDDFRTIRIEAWPECTAERALPIRATPARDTVFCRVLLYGCRAGGWRGQSPPARLRYVIVRRRVDRGLPALGDPLALSLRGRRLALGPAAPKSTGGLTGPRDVTGFGRSLAAQAGQRAARER